MAVAAAALLVALQPVRESWWHWADPDGAYVGNSMNILVGNHTHYLDHPGLPTQDALAIAFGAQYLAEKATGSTASRQAFIDERLLDLDSTRPVYRSWAIALFLASALVAYLAIGRLLGHWTWGSPARCSSSPRRGSGRSRSSSGPTRPSPRSASRSGTSWRRRSTAGARFATRRRLSSSASP